MSPGSPSAKSIDASSVASSDSSQRPGQPPDLVLHTPEALWEAARHQHHLMHDRHLGQVLVEQGLISPEALFEAIEKQDSGAHQPLGQILLKNSAITTDQLRVALANTLDVPVADTQALHPDPVALSCVARTFAVREQVLPLLVKDGTLIVAMHDPWQRPVLDELRFLTQLRVLPVMAVSDTLAESIRTAYDALDAQHPRGRPGQRTGNRTGNHSDIHSLAAELASGTTGREDEDSDGADAISESDNALVRLVNTVIEDAIARRASDIHIEVASSRDPVILRFRIDGTLVPYLELPPRYRRALVARIKIMSDLDIAEHRKPQDGKIDFARFGGSQMELRVVIVPTSHGLEDVVLRLLNSSDPLPLERIGLSEPNLAALRRCIVKPYGLIVICGPTGCGKTTTLHSVLHELNDSERKIWTAEDPIEITQPGLRQVQVNARIGWTFAAAMRTFLRADPDIIMIGEMRDEETARIAVEASLTGHLVMSTLHTNSAPESITRLLEIGIDPFNFSDSLIAVLAQRLVRTLCKQCRQPYDASADEIEAIAHDYLRSTMSDTDAARAALLADWRKRFGDAEGRIRLYRRQGCDVCSHHGYKGRMGLHELLVADVAIRQLVRHKASASELLAAALDTGMHTIRQDGIEKVLAGLTDMSEVLAASNL